MVLDEYGGADAMNPHAYPTEVITKIVNGRVKSRIEELLPRADAAEPSLKHVA
jgi:hypothetical protein